MDLSIVEASGWAESFLSKAGGGALTSEGMREAFGEASSEEAEGVVGAAAVAAAVVAAASDVAAATDVVAAVAAVSERSKTTPDAVSSHDSRL